MPTIEDQDIISCPASEARRCPVVCVGASAGGLEPLEQFFRNVPPDCGIAFVVIQHLDPHHVGMLPELLQHSTQMEVRQVKNGMRAKPGHVYVIPPDRNISILDCTLHLEKPSESSGIRLPIDIFLRSLAAECGENGVGVILSGMGADGTLGAEAVRKRGGFILVQEPSAARFESMPKSIIDAGLADLVAPVEDLPGAIIDHLKATHYSPPAVKILARSEQETLTNITRILKSVTRQDFSAYKTTSLYRRIERRMAVHKISSIGEYLIFIQKNRHEVDLLFKELLIGVTKFFRDNEVWEELKKEILPVILKRYPEGGTIRAWCCGCSTGEEPISLAIIFSELREQMKVDPGLRLQLFATDLDPDAIDKARKGLFPAKIEADVSPDRLERFFVKEDGGYRICKDIREMIVFASQNVIMDPPFTKLDILICRNLLIYLTADLQKKLFPLFHYSLKPDGLLFLGSAESIGSNTGFFTSASQGSRLFWRNEPQLRSEAILFPASLPKATSERPKEINIMQKNGDTIQLLADQLILQHFSSPSVLVNDTGDIIYISGKTGKYLEPAAGKANMNIFAMAREGLRYELGSAFSKTLLQKEQIVARGMTEGLSGPHPVDMILLKIETPESLKGMVLISFRDVAPVAKLKRRRKSVALTDTLLAEEQEQELVKMREELRITREEMQATHEELKSTNEELQSTNEELQSANEELTTSKEEMQSMNEELQTVNAEQSARLEEYSRLNNDMENLLDSTEIVTVFLDNQLQVRRFTTGANKLFKLIPGDLGRPLTDIASNLNYPQLYDHVQDVLRKLVSVENQVSSLDGRWFLVRIMPYRTTEKMIDGVVLTCSDITVAKQLEDTLRQEIERLQTLVAV